jgi:hypothetical protein
MKNLAVFCYALFVLMTAFFWLVGYQSDQRLHAIYAKPAPEFAVTSLPAARAELKAGYLAERNLVGAVHEMHSLNTKATIISVLLTGPLLVFALRGVRLAARQA